MTDKIKIYPDHLSLAEEMLLKKDEAELARLQTTFYNRYQNQERLEHYARCVYGQLPDFNAPIEPPKDYPVRNEWELVPKQPKPSNELVIDDGLIGLKLIGVLIAFTMLCWILSAVLA